MKKFSLLAGANLRKAKGQTTAIVALILLAVFLTATGIQVQGWIRFAVIPVYVLLLCLCSWVVDRLMGRKGNKDKEN